MSVGHDVIAVLQTETPGGIENEINKLIYRVEQAGGSLIDVQLQTLLVPMTPLQYIALVRYWEPESAS